MKDIQAAGYNDTVHIFVSYVLFVTSVGDQKPDGYQTIWLFTFLKSCNFKRKDALELEKSYQPLT